MPASARRELFGGDEHADAIFRAAAKRFARSAKSKVMHTPPLGSRPVENETSVDQGDTAYVIHQMRWVKSQVQKVVVLSDRRRSAVAIVRVGQQEIPYVLDSLRLPGETAADDAADDDGGDTAQQHRAAAKRWKRLMEKGSVAYHNPPKGSKEFPTGEAACQVEPGTRAVLFHNASWVNCEIVSPFVTHRGRHVMVVVRVEEKEVFSVYGGVRLLEEVPAT